MCVRLPTHRCWDGGWQYEITCTARGSLFCLIFLAIDAGEFPSARYPEFIFSLTFTFQALLVTLPQSLKRGHRTSKTWT